MSAHWYTRGTAVTAMEKPRTIHDFGGFPQALFDTQYPAPGSPELAERIQQALAPLPVIADHEQWGFDHGSWGVLIKMYPDADIPVVQLSVDGTQPAEYHYQLGTKLAALRDEGYMIVASGNVVHNLRMVKWDGDATPYDWADSFNQFVKDNLNYQGDSHPLVDFMQHNKGPRYRTRRPITFYRCSMCWAVGTVKEPITVPVDGIVMGALSMLSVQVGR